MVRTTKHYFCDICGREVYGEESLKECKFWMPITKVDPTHPHKEEELCFDEICTDCYDAIEDTIAAIMKKTNQEV
jgi:hypothetical protein